jgi:hypothetical protein
VETRRARICGKTFNIQHPIPKLGVGRGRKKATFYSRAAGELTKTPPINTKQQKKTLINTNKKFEGKTETN